MFCGVWYSYGLGEGMGDVRQLRKNLRVGKTISFVCLFHSLDCEKKKNN